MSNQLPENYILPAALVAKLYEILAQLPAGNVARVFVALEQQIQQQNQAAQTGTDAPAEVQ